MDFLAQHWVLIVMAAAGLWSMAGLFAPGKMHPLWGAPHLRELGDLLAKLRDGAANPSEPASAATSLGVRVSWRYARRDDGSWEHHLSYNLLALGGIGMARASGTMFAAVLLWQLGALQDGWKVGLFSSTRRVWHLLLSHDEAHHLALLARPPASAALPADADTAPLLGQLGPVRDGLLRALPADVDVPGPDSKFL